MFQCELGSPGCFVFLGIGMWRSDVSGLVTGSWSSMGLVIQLVGFFVVT